MYVKKGSYWRTSDVRFQEFIKKEIEPLLSGDRVYSTTLTDDGLNVNFDTGARVYALGQWREKLEDMTFGIKEKIESGETSKTDNSTALEWGQQILKRIGDKIEVLESGDLKPEDCFYGS